MLISFVINDILINNNSWLKDTRLFFNQQLDPAYKKHYYKGRIPRSIIIQGDFASGKSTLFNILKASKGLIVDGHSWRNCFSEYIKLDFEILFLFGKNQYRYHIVISEDNCYEELNFEKNVVDPNKKFQSLISSTTFTEAYEWFNNLYLIPSCYDKQDEFYSAVEKLNSEKSYNDLLSIYRYYLEKRSNGLLKIEGSIERTCSFFKFFNSDSNVYSIPISRLNKSTYDFILSTRLIHFIGELNTGVVFIDDIDFISKGLFLSTINATFATTYASTPIQLIATANSVPASLFKPSKYIYLQTLF